VLVDGAFPEAGPPRIPEIALSSRSTGVCNSVGARSGAVRSSGSGCFRSSSYIARSSRPIRSWTARLFFGPSAPALLSDTAILRSAAPDHESGSLTGGKDPSRAASASSVQGDRCTGGKQGCPRCVSTQGGDGCSLLHEAGREAWLSWGALPVVALLRHRTLAAIDVGAAQRRKPYARFPDKATSSSSLGCSP
jgi:hypothetical protein